MEDYKEGDEVIVNTGGEDIIGQINPNCKSVYGIYWEEQDAWNILFDNRTSQYIESKYITKL